jgi:hypothetical protein
MVVVSNVAYRPDISMLGYLAGNKAGAIIYNFFHHKALGIGLVLSVIFSGSMNCYG